LSCPERNTTPHDEAEEARTGATEDFSPIEPNVSELKVYAKGSGQGVLAVDVSGGSEREELVKYTH
jgi:hypothetical protein